jgi:hypothetical protein
MSFYRLLRSLDNGQEFVVSALALNSRLKYLLETVCESDDLQERGSGRVESHAVAKYDHNLEVLRTRGIVL